MERILGKHQVDGGQVPSGTDIFGGLRHLKALFESNPNADKSHPVLKTLWIFSDMINETKDFPMPALVELGSEQMLERAKANGLLVPLNGDKIYVLGASPGGLTPQMWMIAKNFWILYFLATGAELVSYSAVHTRVDPLLNPPTPTRMTLTVF